MVNFVHVYRQAVEGNEDGWRGLIQLFHPLTERLIQQSFSDVWADGVCGSAVFFGVLRSDNAARLKTFSGMSEKAFLLHLRDELFSFGRTNRGERAPLGMTHEQFAELLNEFPPVSRQAAIMLAKGWPPEKFSVTLHIEISSAEEVLRKANQRFSEMGVSARLPGPIGSGFDRLLHHIEQQEATPECLSTLQIVRIVDGQVNWNDKDAAEKHAAGCLRCLERFATYHEVHGLYQESGQASERQLEAVARSMELPARSGKRKDSLLGRLFGVGKS